MNEVAKNNAGSDRRWLSWVNGGILLGLLNTFAVATYGALGVSRNYSMVDGMLLRLFGSDLPESNSYFSTISGTADWLLMVAVGMVVGGFLAALITGRLKARSVPKLWASRFGDSRPKRFATAFAGGFLLLFGARLAGGCTSGLALSGVAQLAVAGIVFSLAIIGSGILTARLLYREAK